MATIKGRSAVSAFLARSPEQLVDRVLRGAARAGGKVIADSAKDRSVSDDVANAIIVKLKREDHRIIVRITVRPGWMMARAIWLEHGTAPHFITVADDQRKGLSIARINDKVGEARGDGSLVIGGKFVGTTVFHPGARPFPFLRPALDLSRDDAVRAAQQYINARVRPSGITGAEDAGDDE
jgi:hypothetical protein